MLMRFMINNFMSFPHRIDDNGKIQATEFMMYAGRSEHFKERISKLNDRKVLKFASVYGANAAGKSNLIGAIDCGRDILMQNVSLSDLKNAFCRCNQENKEQPTLFEYEFSINGRCFAYGFTVNLWNERVLTEWLAELYHEGETVIFERDAQNSQYFFEETYFSNEDTIQQFHFFLKDVNRIHNSLLLYELERRNLDEEDFRLFHLVYQWFQKNLVVIYPETKMGESYLRFGSDNKRLIQILEYLDTGITDYIMQSMNEASFREYFSDYKLADKFLDKNKNRHARKKAVLKYQNTLFELDYGEEKTKIAKLLFQHGENGDLYEYGEESDGTQRLIELLEIIMNDQEEKTFIIDELDRSLHPQMTKKFVETFFQFSNLKQTQLIITTHESNLMDLTLLRRDEIWFAERDKYHSTVLYPLEKFKIRYDKVVSKDYLAGRYGAVPIFKDFAYVWRGNEDETAEFEDSETI